MFREQFPNSQRHAFDDDENGTSKTYEPNTVEVHEMWTFSKFENIVIVVLSVDVNVSYFSFLLFFLSKRYL